VTSSSDMPRRYNVVVRRKCFEVWADSPAGATQKALAGLRSGDSFYRINPDYDVIVEEDVKGSRAAYGFDPKYALTPEEFYSEMHAFLGRNDGKGGYKKLFEALSHHFSFHAHDRGEHEDWKPRPLNDEQYKLIQKLADYSEDEFRHGVADYSEDVNESNEPKPK
jgi:hypothetical protein